MNNNPNSYLQVSSRDCYRYQYSILSKILSSWKAYVLNKQQCKYYQIQHMQAYLYRGRILLSTMFYQWIEYINQLKRHKQQYHKAIQRHIQRIYHLCYYSWIEYYLQKKKKLQVFIYQRNKKILKHIFICLRRYKDSILDDTGTFQADLAGPLFGTQLNPHLAPIMECKLLYRIRGWSLFMLHPGLEEDITGIGIQKRLSIYLSFNKWKYQLKVCRLQRKERIFLQYLNKKSIYRSFINWKDYYMNLLKKKISVFKLLMILRRIILRSCIYQWPGWMQYRLSELMRLKRLHNVNTKVILIDNMKANENMNLKSFIRVSCHSNSLDLIQRAKLLGMISNTSQSHLKEYIIELMKIVFMNWKQYTRWKYNMHIKVIYIKQLKEKRCFYNSFYFWMSRTSKTSHRTITWMKNQKFKQLQYEYSNQKTRLINIKELQKGKLTRIDRYYN